MFTHTSFFNQQDIVSEARSKAAKWIVFFIDHYKANGKGYYQSVDNFAKSKVFRWCDGPDDRGAIKVYLTDENIPALISERKALIDQFNLILYRRYPVDDISIKKIDHRMKLTNPIRLKAERHNEHMRSLLSIRKAEWEKKLSLLREQIKKTHKVSSTMIELFI